MCYNTVLFIMKTTKLIITALLGVFINVATAENYSLGTKYTSDYFFRGALNSEEAVQATVGVNGEHLGFNYSVEAFTNQAVSSGGSDSYIIAAGGSKSFMDGLLNGYVGLNHTEDVPGNCLLEAKISLSIDTILSPTASVYRNLDDSLYTYELSLSHAIDIGVGELAIGGTAGSTDLSNTQSEAYYAAGVGLSRKISESATATLDFTRVDSDLISEEYVVGLGISVSF